MVEGACSCCMISAQPPLSSPPFPSRFRHSCSAILSLSTVHEGREEIKHTHTHTQRYRNQGYISNSFVPPCVSGCGGRARGGGGVGGGWRTARNFHALETIVDSLSNASLLPTPPLHSATATAPTLNFPLGLVEGGGVWAGALVCCMGPYVCVRVPSCRRLFASMHVSFAFQWRRAPALG